MRRVVSVTFIAIIALLASSAQSFLSPHTVFSSHSEESEPVHPIDFELLDATSQSRGRVIRSDGGDGFYLVGDFQGSLTKGGTTIQSNGQWDVFLAHINSDGSWDWLISGGGSNGDSVYGMVIDDAGDIIICAEFWGAAQYGSNHVTGHTSADVVIAKAEKNGTWMWAKEATGPGEDRPRNIAIYGTNIALMGDHTDGMVLGEHVLQDSPTRDVYLGLLTGDGQSWYGAELLAEDVGTRDLGLGIDAIPGGGVVLSGFFQNQITLDDHSVTSAGSRDIFVASLSVNGVWDWLVRAGGTGEAGPDIRVMSSPDGGYVVAGNLDGESEFGNHTVTTNAQDKALVVAKLDSEGNWIWAREADGPMGDYPKDMTIDSMGRIYSIGLFGNQMSFAGITIYDDGSGLMAYVARMTSDGEWDYAYATPSIGRSVTTASSDRLWATGYSLSGDAEGWLVTYDLDVDDDGFTDGIDNCPNTENPSQNDLDEDDVGDLCDSDIDGDGRVNEDDDCPQGAVNWDSFSPSLDHDSDGCNDEEIEDLDDDNDGILDGLDNCMRGSLNWTSNSSTDHDGDGCHDDWEDGDDDGDGVLDSEDDCARGLSGWYSYPSTDWDSDGCQDEGEDDDDDSDTIPDELDACPKGTIDWISTAETDADGDGCPGPFSEEMDGDGDGVRDGEDTCPSISGNSSTEGVLGCPDGDGDGWADLIDDFPVESTQWRDTDGDGWGDESGGWRGDDCISSAGNSTISMQGCPDSDGDGWPNLLDEFPDVKSQWVDKDGDGFGDNRTGMNPDECPDEAGEIRGCPSSSFSIIENNKAAFSGIAVLILVILLTMLISVSTSKSSKED